MPNTQKNKYAGFGRRLLAFLADWLVLAIIGIGISKMLGRDPFAPTTSDALGIIDLLLTITVDIMYFVIFWTVQDGQTPGKRLLNIKILREDGKKIDIGTACIREISTIVSMIVLGFGYFWVLFDSKRQSWHDKFAKTIVINTGKGPKKMLIFIIIFAWITLLTIEGWINSQTKNNNKEPNISTYEQSQNVKILDPKTQQLIELSQAKLVEASKLVEQGDTVETNPEIMKLISGSINNAKEATEVAPENSTTWYALGNVYVALIGAAIDSDKFAINAYTKAIELSPENFLYYESLKDVYIKTKDNESAIVKFNELISLNPQIAYGYYHLGYFYKLDGKDTRAKKAFENALERLPDSSAYFEIINTELDSI